MRGRDAAVFNERRLGPYALVRKLGQGGFAEVWLARRPGPGGFESRVAIKLVKFELSTDPVFQKMFLDEAKLAARINHPNVVSIFELGELEHLLYLVMEYVRGRPLADLNHMMTRAGTPIPPGIVMRILADTCAGLHAAHEVEHDGKSLGVIHRDVSPQNILVSDKGTVKLIDFGIAKANDRLSADTTDGVTKGKLQYMAPEQAVAIHVDRRADIWAVGAVAFHLLEGHPPYDGQNELARLFKLTSGDPPPPLTANVPAPIAAVIQKALQLRPEARWSTAQEMRLAIEAALDECNLRVTADTVTAFFGDALTSDANYADVERPSDAPPLRDRLGRKSARVEMETMDVPVADSPGAPAARHGQPDADGAVETLSALNTSARGVSRSPSRTTALAIVGVLVLIAGAVAIGLRHDPPVAPAAGPTSAPAAASMEAQVAPPAIVAAPAAPAASAPPAIEIDPRPPATGPRKKPLGATKPPNPHPSKPAPSSTSPPRYDDTIQ
jgi:eukaryotic-like serine/threonine-protein kinase